MARDGLWILAGLLCVPGLLAQRAHAELKGAAPPFVATPAVTFEYRGDPPLHMPTAVAVAAEGTVYVADGVRDRILVFAATAELVAEIRSVGGQSLSRPTSLKIDAAGRLWVADTGNRRVLARAPDGTLARELRWPVDSAARPPDITDVALSADGRSVWLVDNDNHRLGRFELESGAVSVVGGVGESLGQFHYPFMLAISATGDIYVTEVLNARAQVLDATGRAVGSLGTFGVDLGNLYRPKGIAVDADGNAWVVDGTLGVIQVFTPAGTLIDVVRDAGGRPLKLETPCGLAFDAAGQLYVTELLPNRVQKFTLQRDAHAAAARPIGRPRPARTAQSRSCAVCHLEWVEPLVSGGSTVLMSPPASSPEEPIVSSAATCLSCHDASVADSRYRVWEVHGHRTGIKPPPGMQIPANLPLVNGALACRTCHSAHTNGDPSGDVNTAVFLRVRNAASELCVSCHADKTRGPPGASASGRPGASASGRQLGTHPTGGMPWPVPQTLVDAGAKLGPNPRELTCQVCHTPHGAAHEHLLVLGTSSNQLCLTCHEQMRPGMFRDAGQAEHPLSPPANEEQAAAVHAAGTQLSPDGRLICLSCHKLHHGKGERFLLAQELTDGQMCLSCHSDKHIVLGGMHDLRERFPEERNRLGMTASTGGPCSSCHLFHRYARPPEASTLDPGGGKCITCHQPGRIAESKSLGPLNHPRAPCTACHDPHQTEHADFLAVQPSERCRECHGGYGALAGGPHDVSRNTSTWPTAAQETQDACLACHRPHGSAATGLFRVAAAAAAPGGDAACLACHPQAGPHADGKTALVHPRDAGNLRNLVGLPLAYAAEGGVTTQPAEAVGTAPEGRRQLACKTCHNPHVGGDAAGSLLRVGPGQPAHELCETCHSDTVSIAAIGHARESLQTAGFDADACQPCHAVHADRQEVEGSLLWPKRLVADAAVLAAAAPADRYCLGCHRAGGPVTPPAIATHPVVQMFNPDPSEAPGAMPAPKAGMPRAPAGQAGFLPLFNAQGEIDPNGSISCRTCHLTHGRSEAAALPDDWRAGAMPAPKAGMPPNPPENLIHRPEADATPTPREVRARKYHIRSFGPSTVCTTCHGFDGLRRFMYFHDPARRGGPIDGGGAGGGAPGRGRRAF